MDEVLQYCAVAIIVATAAMYIYKHFKSSKSDCDSCPLSNACNKPKKNKKKK